MRISCFSRLPFAGMEYGFKFANNVKITSMRKLVLLLLCSICGLSSFAQFRLGIFGGLSNYQGDLVDKYYKSSRGAFGITGTYQLSQRFSLRAGLTFAKVAGADSLNQQADLRARNLSFQSSITEFSLVGEYNIFNIEQVRWTPYVFGGVAVFRFNPYTLDASGNEVFLQPLTTEGQGLPGYPNQPYRLTQFAIPFGGGVKYALSDRVQLGLELGLRKLFTDYLDDVSGNYADEADLLAGRGQQSADLAYRGDELPGGDPVAPGKGITRGSPKFKDYYYFTGLHLNIQLGESRDRSGLGCPKVTW
jgi:hypothetical protein